MDGMSWIEEAGKLLFQCIAALAGRQSVWFYLHGCPFCIDQRNKSQVKDRDGLTKPTNRLSHWMLVALIVPEDIPVSVSESLQLNFQN